MAADDPTNGTPVPTTQGRQFNDELRHRLQQVEAELDETRRHLDEARFERDSYKRLFMDEAAKSVKPLTAEELAGAIPARPWIDDLIRDMERS
jgi:hypothetical protein